MRDTWRKTTISNFIYLSGVDVARHWRKTIESKNSKKWSHYYTNVASFGSIKFEKHATDFKFWPSERDHIEFCHDFTAKLMHCINSLTTGCETFETTYTNDVHFDYFYFRGKLPRPSELVLLTYDSIPANFYRGGEDIVYEVVRFISSE